MRLMKTFALGGLLIGTIGTALFLYHYLTQTPSKSFFKVKQVQRRTIRHNIQASGILDVKQSFKIGSLISGIIESVHVQENQHVKKGDLLARINNGKEDTDLQAARYNFIHATEEYEYQKKLFARYQALYQSGQVAADTYEFREKEYKKATATMHAHNEIFKKNTIDYNNRNIVAPDDGIITAVYASKGMSVLNDYLNTLFELALDITDLEATLDIDECDIGHIETGQKVHLTVSTYPEKIFKGTITNVSLTPKTSNSFGNFKQTLEGPPYYKAKVSLKNNENLLRPGMGVNAKINVKKSKNALSINGLSLQINPKTIAKLSKIYGYRASLFDEQEKKEICKKRHHERIKFVTIVEGKSISEKPISLGVTDDTWWEIKQGLTDQDYVIIDIEEPENMEKLYTHLFRKL